jgi:hypothetical protein
MIRPNKVSEIRSTGSSTGLKGILETSDIEFNAGRLTLQIYRMLGREIGGGFNRPLNYPRYGVA